MSQRSSEYGETDQALAEARSVDAAIVKGLRALGFERLPVVIEIALQSRGEFGAKTPRCVLRLSASYIREMLVGWDRPDSVIRTWSSRSDADVRFSGAVNRWRSVLE